MLPTVNPAGSPGHTFDAFEHLYRDETGTVRPSITALLEMAGEVDTDWFTVEGKQRGTAVHQLTLDYDLDALTLTDVDACPINRQYRGYLAGWASIRAVLNPAWEFLEQDFMHPTHPRFGGRPDRGGEVNRVKSTMEIKSGGPHASHAIQTALQAILLSAQWRIPAVTIRRYVAYLRADGKFSVEEFTRRADFDRAFAILRKHAA